jgi:hypothetical protein
MTATPRLRRRGGPRRAVPTPARLSPREGRTPQELLRSSAAYATARLSFANAIVIAQRAGETDEETAHVTGYTVPMIRAVLRSR